MFSTHRKTDYCPHMITPAQIRAARAFLKWRQSDLAERSGVAEISIKNIEAGKTDPRASTLQAIEDAFAAVGIDFLRPGQPSHDGGIGLRLRH